MKYVENRLQYVNCVCVCVCVLQHLQAIHEKIMELNFNDCHAKIRQVDCQPTLGSGVLVQVCYNLCVGFYSGAKHSMYTFL